MCIWSAEYQVGQVGSAIEDEEENFCISDLK